MSDWLGQWVRSAALGQAAMSPGDWRPFNVWAFEPLIGDAWIRLWLETMRQAEEQDVDLKTLADLVVPSLWRKELRFLSYDAKVWGYGKKDRLRLAGFFKRMLDEVYDADPFGLSSNLPKSYPPVTVFENADWQKADPESARQVGRISSSCPSLSWSLFTDFYYSNSYELMGLFPAPSFGKDALLMVKQFGPYRCPGLWPKTRAYQYDQILIGAIYKNLSGRFDIINHFITSDSLPRKMTHFAVLADGKPVSDLRALDHLQHTLAAYAKEQFPVLDGLPFEALKKKGAQIKFHQFKAVFDALKIDWKPPKDLLSCLEGVSAYPDVHLPSAASFESRVKQWEALLDPRIDFRATQRKRWDEWTARTSHATLG